MTKLTSVLVLFAIAVFSIGSLVSGASYSEWTLPGGLPLGNALAAVGPCALAGMSVLISAPHSTCRRLSQISLLAAALWLPLSVALAGNLSLNFAGFRGSVWILISSVTALLVLGSLIWSIAGSLLRPSGYAQDRAEGPE